MRIGGLASGMEIDSLVDQLMTAERIPLNKMEQDKTLLEWERDGFRDINKKLSELENMMLDMKLSKTYNSKTVSSTQESAVRATGSPSASNGAYQIEVSQLATNAINVSTETVGQEIPSDYIGKTYEYYTYDDQGEQQTNNIMINADDSVKDVLKRISEADNNVRAFYDEQANRVVMETTSTGNHNKEQAFGEAQINAEIGFKNSNTFFRDVLKLDVGNEQGGTNAMFTYNGAHKVETNENNYTLNGINFEFKDTNIDNPATLTVSNNVDAAFDSIMAFVDKYNEVVETLNGSQQEEKYRDYPPLTSEQKEEMSEDEIELWEEKAKSGILRGESAISNGLFSMRQSWYSAVETGGAHTSLTHIGITTTTDYLDGGKLEVDEGELRAALQNNPRDVQKLLSNSEEGAGRGLINRLEDALDSTMDKIGDRAGRGGDTLENYTLGKRMKELDERIDGFEDRLTQVENRYWSQFTAMETAISRMNQQSMMLMNNFGGGQA
ncbi:flagellar hook-associated protein 2 [Virgibacillus ainsalahensis]